MTSKRGNILLLLISGVALISLTLAGYLLWQNQQLSNKIPALTQQPLVPQPVKPIDETANWKTFTDSQNRFSFRYPPTMVVNTNGFVGGSGEIKTSDFSLTNPPTGYKIEFQVAPGGHSLDGQAAKLCQNAMTGSKIDNCVISDKIINGSRAIFATYSNGDKTYLIFGQNLGVEFVGNSIKSSYIQIYDQILSTFKFLDKQTANSGFKTYTNQFAKFKINYPDDWTASEQFFNNNPQQGNVAISSPEAAQGVIIIYWGGGFGGGPCSGPHQKVETKAGLIDMCKKVFDDGSENFSRANDAQGETFIDKTGEALMFAVSLKSKSDEQKAFEILKTFDWL